MKYFLIILMLVFVSCDDILDPSSDYLIDKKINPSQEEQIFKIGNDFQIIIPANSLNGELQIQVKKESTPPAFSFADSKLGDNVYRIKILNISALLAPAKIFINYDKSQVPVGRDVTSCVHGYVYNINTWKQVPSIIDESSSQLIISIGNDLSSKILKDESILLTNNSEIIIGDGYKINLPAINDKDKCDCGWNVDYSQLTKKVDTDANSVYYVNSSGQKHGPEIFYWDDAQTKVMLSQCYFENVENGLALGYWQNGNLMAKTTYKNGQLDGYHLTLFENGKKGSEGNNVDGKKDGLWIAWYENGNKYSEEFYIAGVKNGAFAKWFEDGKQDYAGIYKNDLKEGRWSNWYSNGQKKSDGVYKADEKEGRWDYWYESGTLQLFENYKNGKWDGKSESYFENGNIKVTGSFTDGKESGIWCWYLENGLCKSCYDWDRGVEVRCP